MSAREMMVIGRDAVRKLLPMSTAIELVERALVATSRGAAIQPLRQIVPLPKGLSRGLGVMPGYLGEPECFGCKVTAVYPENFEKGEQSHQGVIVLFDASSGAPVAAVHGGEITAIRTAAASAVATRHLARRDAGVLAVLGYGEQAREHLEAIMAVREIKEIRVWGRRIERARNFAASARSRYGIEVEAARSAADAVAGADVICTTTSAKLPILEGANVPAGSHLNVVGSSERTSREIDSDTVRIARFYVDYKAMARAEAGELLVAIEEGVVDEKHVIGEIGEVILGLVDGRRSDEEITLYKSLGISSQDLICANYLYRRLLDDPDGTCIAF